MNSKYKSMLRIRALEMAMQTRNGEEAIKLAETYYGFISACRPEGCQLKRLFKKKDCSKDQR